MANFWLRFKVWTKLTLIFLVLFYILVFLAKNSERPTVKLWYFVGREYEGSLITTMLMCLGVGVVGTLLAGTTLRTIKQVRDLRAKNRTLRMEREMAEMRTKAARLQTKSEPTGAPSPQSNPIPMEENPQ
jgi:uncharacterized integral membrane protein